MLLEGHYPRLRHIYRLGSREQMGQQYLSLQQGLVPILRDRRPGGQSSVRFGPHQDPPALLHPSSREQAFSGIPIPTGTLLGGHCTIPMVCHQNLKPETSVRCCCWKAITHTYEHIYLPGSREQEFPLDTDTTGGKWGNNTYHHNRDESQS